MQKWEYKTILRRRDWTGESPGAATKWNVSMKEELPKLGEEGWELVAVSARSGMLGGLCHSLGTDDFAGFTNEELWVFKRPEGA